MLSRRKTYIITMLVNNARADNENDSVLLLQHNLRLENCCWYEKRIGTKIKCILLQLSRLCAMSKNKHFTMRDNTHTLD